jgi:hypothetical protein
MATTPAEKRRAKKAPATPHDSSRTVLWSILSAAGGAGLVFLGQVAIEEYRASRESERETIQSQKQAEQRRDERADTLFDDYQKLGDRVDRAGEYVTTGRGGSREDVLAVVRHFRAVIAGIYAERADPDEVALLYGGRLIFWSNELEKIARGRSPVAKQFTGSQREAYLVLSTGLRSLIQPDTRSPSETRRGSVEKASPRALAAANVQAAPQPRNLYIPQPIPVPPTGGEEAATVSTAARDPERRVVRTIRGENATQPALSDAQNVVEARIPSPDSPDR